MTAIEVTPESIDKLIKEKKRKEKKESKERKEKKKRKREKKDKKKEINQVEDEENVIIEVMKSEKAKENKNENEITSMGINVGKAENDEQTDSSISKVDKKKNKEAKKAGKKRKHASQEFDEEKVEITVKETKGEDEESLISSKKGKKKLSDKRMEKIAAKEALMEKVPTRDEHGIAYTKIQIRRMLRRVKRGLPPVPTEQEENERRREMKLEKELEQKEWADMIYQKDNDETDDREDDDAANEKEVGEYSDEEEIYVSENEVEASSETLTTSENKDETSFPLPVLESLKTKKKARRTKPVPPDYVCMACHGKHQPSHWIYDCPDKKTMPGTNQKSTKGTKGVHDPDARKVFVSGLPFEIKQKEVEEYFESNTGGKVVHCKLLTFEDTQRCKGNAFVTFDTEDHAKIALKMNGNIFERKEKKKKIEGNEEDEKQKTKKQLKLGVTKVLNRLKTKKRKQR